MEIGNSHNLSGTSVFRNSVNFLQVILPREFGSFLKIVSLPSSFVTFGLAADDMMIYSVIWTVRILVPPLDGRLVPGGAAFVRSVVDASPTVDGTLSRGTCVSRSA